VQALPEKRRPSTMMVVLRNVELSSRPMSVSVQSTTTSDSGRRLARQAYRQNYRRAGVTVGDASGCMPLVTMSTTA
jgi:hypothetical protein